MKTLTLEVATIKNNKVILVTANKGSFKITASRRSPYLKDLKLQKGDLVNATFSKPKVKKAVKKSGDNKQSSKKKRK